MSAMRKGFEFLFETSIFRSEYKLKRILKGGIVSEWHNDCSNKNSRELSQNDPVSFYLAGLNKSGPFQS
jgi:hypothetical protein